MSYSLKYNSVNKLSSIAISRYTQNISWLTGKSKQQVFYFHRNPDPFWCLTWLRIWRYNVEFSWPFQTLSILFNSNTGSSSMTIWKKKLWYRNWISILLLKMYINLVTVYVYNLVILCKLSELCLYLLVHLFPLHVAKLHLSE